MAIAVAIQKDVPVELRSIGTAHPLLTVSVRSQISGELQTAHFKEGQMVQQGQLLFTIDPRTYQAAIDQAEANLGRDRVQAQNAEIVARRMERAYQVQAATQDELDQARTDAAAKLAAVQADNAALQTAKLQLQYCYIHSPISGRTGSILIDPGNIVKANDLPLVTINQLQPVSVVFSLPQQNLADVRYYQSQHPLAVQALLNSDEAHPAFGQLTVIDNQVDTSTGTFQLKATFPNDDQRLWPGQFVDAILSLTTQKDAIIVPFRAVQSGQEGRFVFIVKQDQTVETHRVTLGQMMGTSVVVLSGVSAGERVVTDGQIRLRPGAPVSIQRTDIVELPPEYAATAPATQPVTSAAQSQPVTTERARAPTTAPASSEAQGV